MSKPVRNLFLATLGLLVVVGVAALAVYHGMRQVPSFYLAALEQDETVQTEASDACLRQAAALVSSLQRSGRWQAQFTADQINGWLAVDLTKNYPGALPSEIDSPRVDIQSEHVTLACGYKRGDSTTVVSISLDLYLAAPNVAALRVRSVRAGALPVPLASVLDAISAAARNFDLELEWRQLHGDPVALVKLPALFDDDENQICLDAIELRDGAVFLAGQTGTGNNELARLEKIQPSSEVIDSPAEPETVAVPQSPENTSLEAAGDDVISDDEMTASESEPAENVADQPSDDSKDDAAQIEVGSAASENVQR